MPFRLNEFRTKIQFIAPAAFPNMIYRACVKTDTVSNTRYIQEAIAERLSRDLDVPLESLLALLPEPQGRARDLLHGDGDGKLRPRRPIEEVK